MRIFDVHVHIFPDKIAEKASQAIGRFYGGTPRYDGALRTVLPLMDEAGVTAFCAHSVATAPAQCAPINDFILACAAANPGRIVPFAALHPGLEDVDAYVENALARGFRGFKIHPDIQNFPLDREDARRMIAAVEGRAPLLIHTGDNRFDNSGPRKVADMLDRFPNLTAICAHLAGYSQWDEARELLAGRNIYTDTSSSLFFLPPEHAVEIIRAYGADRTFYGCDYPMWNPKEELERFLALPLTEQEREDILWNNAARMFGL